MQSKTLLFNLFIVLFFSSNSYLLNAQNPECADGSASSKLEMDVNNVKADIYPRGNLFLNPAVESGYEVPKGSGHNPILSAGLWLGGIASDNKIRVAAQSYGTGINDFWPGPINETQSTAVTAEVCSDFDKVFTVSGIHIAGFIQNFESSGGVLPINAIHSSILKWPARNNPHFDEFSLPVNKDLAPFWDRDGDGIYDPTKGDYPVLDPEIEGVYPSQMNWWILNDIGNEHSVTGGDPLGVEINCLAYAFASEVEALNDATFYKFKIRAAQRNLKDFYFGFYTDINIGGHWDDFVGSIPELNTGYIYNGPHFDDDYGLSIPMVGVRFLRGLETNDGVGLGMTSLIYNALRKDYEWSEGTDYPDTEEEFYNLLQGVWSDGTPMTRGGTGYGGTEITKFAFDGDPSDFSGWTECSASNFPLDKRIIMGSGPIDLKVGTSQEIDLAIYWVLPPSSSHPCPEVSYLTDAIEEAASFTDIVSVNERQLSALEVNLRPNPMNEQAVLNIIGEAAFAKTVELYTLEGQLLQTYEMKASENELLIERNNLPNGIYFYKVYGGKKTVKVGKMVVN